MINSAFWESKEVRKAFLDAYKGWVEICKPQRIKNGGCSECPLDGYHSTGICGSFQSIGRFLGKIVPKKVNELERVVSDLNTRKTILDHELSDFQEFMKYYECPGPDLFQPSRGQTQ